MLAASLLLSMPPAGGDVRLSGWDWTITDSVGGSNESRGVRWSAETLTVTGTWDGQTLTVENVMRASPATIGGPVETVAEPECTGVHNTSGLDGLDGVRGWSHRVVDGRCHLVIQAVGPTASLDAALAVLGDNVDVEYLLTPA